MNDLQHTLLAAATLISRKEDFARFATARTSDNYFANATDSHAAKWDVFGAVRAVAPTSSLYEKATDKLRTASEYLYGRHPIELNDFSSRRKVAQMFRNAIERAA